MIHQLLTSTSHLNAFELAWRAATQPCSMRLSVALEYDTHSFMFYNKLEYRGVPAASTRVTVRNRSELEEAFLRLVKGEFGTATDRGPVPAPPLRETSELLSPAALEAYRDDCERTLLSGMLDRIAGPKGSKAEQVLRILSDRSIGNAKNSSNVQPHQFAERFEPATDAQRPLTFVLPSFPFKDQNRFRTDAPASHIDIGEVALLVRLHILALAISQFYSHNAHWILVTDGLVYCDILHAPRVAAERYRETLRVWRNHLNLQSTVSIVDFEEAIARRGPFGDQNSREWMFVELVDHYTLELEDLAASSVPGSDMERQLGVLMRGMLWNINLNVLATDFTDEHLWDALNGRTGAVPAAGDARLSELLAACRKASIRYAAFNIAAGDAAILGTVFPQAIRATVHPKKGQIAVPRLGKVFPWNGVGVVRTDAGVFEAVESHPLYAVPSGAGRVFLPDGASPFGYKVTP